MSSAVDPQGRLEKASSVVVQLESIIEGQRVKSHSSICFAGQDKYRADSKIGIIPVESRGLNGQAVWKKNAAGMVSGLNGANAAPMRFLVNFMKPGAKFEQLFEKIEWNRKKYRLNKIECFMLVCYPPPELKLPPYILYVDRAEWLIRRTEITAPEFGRNIKVVTDFHRYGACNGVNLPAEYTIYLPAVTFKIKTTNMILNAGYPDNFFAVPAAGF
ncbi:MAG: hypothetical protein ACYC4Q_02515 [Victivallaceae bacterium]